MTGAGRRTGAPRGAGRLAGRRIIVTRPRDRAGPLVAALEAEGAQAVPLPVIRVVPPADEAPLRDAAARLQDYDRVVFTSVYAVRALTRAVTAAGGARGRIPAACVGPATAAAAREAGWRVDVVPGRAGAEALVDRLSAGDLAGRRVLFPRAEDALPIVARGLRSGGAEVHDVVAYRKASVPSPPGQPDVQALVEGADAITFTSPSTVRRFFERLDGERARSLPAAVIGPATAAEYRERTGREPVVAAESSVGGLVTAVVNVFSRTEPEERE